MTDSKLLHKYYMEIVKELEEDISNLSIKIVQLLEERIDMWKKLDDVGSYRSSTDSILLKSMILESIKGNLLLQSFFGVRDSA